MATYSFLSVQAAITGMGGAFALGNGAAVAEEGITIEMADEKDSMSIGADGNVMHSLHAGNSGTVTVRLLKTSPVNALLMAMYNVQRLNPPGWGGNTLTITNTNSGDTLTARECAFKKQPVLTYAKDAGMNEWTFNAGKIDGILGVY